MDKKDKHIEDLRAIHNLMERSSIFVNLSGIGAIIVGLCALAGSWFAHRILWQYSLAPYTLTELKLSLLTLAAIVFFSALGIYVLFVWLRSRQLKAKFWNATARKISINFGVPFLSGSLVVFHLLTNDYISMVAPVSIIVYGIAVFCASHNSFVESRLLAVLEIALGVVALWFPGQGLWFWMVGFGLLHILYGIVFWFNHERKTT